MSRDDVLQLFRLIDWMMELPEALGQLFDQEVESLEQEGHMPYVTSTERRAKRDGQIEMLIRALEKQFHIAVPEEIAARIRGTTDGTILERWFDLVFEAKSFEEFQQRMGS